MEKGNSPLSLPYVFNQIGNTCATYQSQNGAHSHAAALSARTAVQIKTMTTRLFFEKKRFNLFPSFMMR